MICREAFRDLEDVEIEFLVKSGRFLEEKNIEIYITYRGTKKRLLVMKMFTGRPPHYRKWIEVFMINKELIFNNKIFKFIDSIYEDNLIECLSNILQGGERLFIEYVYDYETRKALEIGVPPPLTRLGYILFKNGFTWFKDWYFPEGFMEGNPKLQAEKPIDENIRRKHIDEICREVRENIDRIKALRNLGEYTWIMDNVLKRAEHILKLCKY
ncbi:MAG: DUF1122 family protein [Ignisphaera sp.]